MKSIWCMQFVCLTCLSFHSHRRNVMISLKYCMSIKFVLFLGFPFFPHYHPSIISNEEVLPEKKKSWRKRWRWNKGSGTSSGPWAPFLCGPELAPGRPSPRHKTSESWFRSGFHSSALCDRPWTSFESPIDQTQNKPCLSWTVPFWIWVYSCSTFPVLLLDFTVGTTKGLECGKYTQDRVRLNPHPTFQKCLLFFQMNEINVPCHCPLFPFIVF